MGSEHCVDGFDNGLPTQRRRKQCPSMKKVAVPLTPLRTPLVKSWLKHSFNPHRA